MHEKGNSWRQMENCSFSEQEGYFSLPFFLERARERKKGREKERKRGKEAALEAQPMTKQRD